IERANYRDVRQIRVNELARDGKDQAGLNRNIDGIAGAGRLVGVDWQKEIGKGKTSCGVGHRCDRLLNCITGKINPLEKMRDLVSADALSNFQHLQAAGFAAKRRIEAGATLFDVSEVEGRDVGDNLDVIGVVEIGIGDGDGGMVGDGQGLRKGRTKVWVFGAAIAGEPTSV